MKKGVSRLGSSHFLFKAAIACAWSVRSSVVLFREFSSARRCDMPRRGWQTVEVPPRWFDRAQRLSSPTIRSRSRTSAKAQRSPPSASTDGNERRTPEDVLQGARARVAKLEIAISAAGESDPTFPGLQEALKQARRQAQVQPVESRIRSSEFFIERTKKRLENARKEVEDAKPKVVSAETTLVSEMSSLQEGEQRHAALLAVASRTSEQPPPTMPWISQPNCHN